MAEFIQDYIGKQGKLSFTVGEVNFGRETSFLDAILECAHPPIRLTIWEEDPADATRIKIVYEGGHPTRTITHVYHHRGRHTHFELMAETNKPLYSLLPLPPVEMSVALGTNENSSANTERKKQAFDENIDIDQAKHDDKKLAQACADRGIFSTSHSSQPTPHKQPDQNPSFSC